MTIYLQEGDDPFGATELTISMVDAGGDSVVWALQAGREERVFFETPPAPEPIDVLDAAFEARRRMKEDSNG